MKPTTCTLLLGIFISTSLHVSSNYVPIIRGTYCITFFKWSQLHAHYFLVYLFQLLYMFRTTCVPIIRRTYCIYATLVFVTLYGGCLVCCSRQPPDDVHIVARNMYRSWNKYTKKDCEPSWLHFKKISICTFSDWGHIILRILCHTVNEIKTFYS